MTTALAGPLSNALVLRACIGPAFGRMLTACERATSTSVRAKLDPPGSTKY